MKYVVYDFQKVFTGFSKMESKYYFWKITCAWNSTWELFPKHIMTSGFHGSAWLVRARGHPPLHCTASLKIIIFTVVGFFEIIYRSMKTRAVISIAFWEFHTEVDRQTAYKVESLHACSRHSYGLIWKSLRPSVAICFTYKCLDTQRRPHKGFS